MHENITCRVCLVYRKHRNKDWGEPTWFKRQRTRKTINRRRKEGRGGGGRRKEGKEGGRHRGRKGGMDRGRKEGRMQSSRNLQ